MEAVDLVTECPHCGYEIRNPRPALTSETLVLDEEATHGAVPSAVTLANAAEPAPPPTNQPDPLLGSDFHVYQVESVLGQGGMGRVYLARHRDLHRRCALKILLPELVERQSNFIERFMNEGRAAAALSHPNIITVHAVGQERDTYFLEMEFVPGRSLGRVLHDEQRLNPLKATLLAARIADGLAEAHRLGIVHRDLKPDNVRSNVLKAGYDCPSKGFDGKSCGVNVLLGKQSPDIARGVGRKKKKAQGAGDQGMMFGFACNETNEFMPLPIALSHELVKRQAEVREKGSVKGLRPDAKSQVTVEYDGLKPLRVTTVVLSTQHAPEWNGPAGQKRLRAEVIKHIIKPVLGKWWNSGIKVWVNPTGQFEIGGPHGDCGLTGRKIIVDTYGGRGRHGGGAFSGKDPSKVDRSAAYMCRYIA
ncbi:MAG: methionine adenosyltransferase domain-containing protein, partial [Planctomycetaceae bacterium]